jgi:DNA-binding protein HU-beta
MKPATGAACDIDRAERLPYRSAAAAKAAQRTPFPKDKEERMAGKADIVDYIADNVEGISKRQATEAFESAIEAISMHLEKGDRVQVPGFGSFSVSARAARTGRNPKTGESIDIPASKNIRFKPGKDLKDSLNG